MDTPMHPMDGWKTEVRPTVLFHCIGSYENDATKSAKNSMGYKRATRPHRVMLPLTLQHEQVKTKTKVLRKT
jgi:hypothetical protein